MSTILQQNLAKEIIKNAKRKKPLNKGQLVELGGYSKTVAEAKPDAIMSQKGVTDALEDYGFSLDNAKKVVTSIMLDNKQKSEARLRATDQVFKVHHAYEDGSNTTRPIIINMPLQVSQSFNINGTDTEAIRSNPQQEQI